MLDAHLPRPAGMDPVAWEAINSSHERLQQAAATGDKPLIIGSAKELVEAVARVVLLARGKPASNADEYGKVLGAAHREIEHQTGPGIAPDASVRNMADLARKQAGHLRQLRNKHGTGHGRALVTDVEVQVCEFSVTGALLWSRWALWRLDALLLSPYRELIADLRGNTRFPTGQLATQLRETRFPHLPSTELKDLGLAVGQRAARDTFNVRIDGVKACADNPKVEAWPNAYREGVVYGLFIDTADELKVDKDALAPPLAARILVPHPEAARVVGELARQIRKATWSHTFRKLWNRTADEMLRAAKIFRDPDAQRIWTDAAAFLKDCGPRYDATHG